MDLSLITRLEEFIPVAKNIGDGIYTVGYGTTRWMKDNRPVEKGERITKEEAIKEMVHFVNTKIEPKLDEIEADYGEIPVYLKESLRSLMYNCGENIVSSKIFRDALDKKSVKLMSRWFKMYNKVKGEVWSGLVARRDTEIKNFEYRTWV